MVYYAGREMISISSIFLLAVSLTGTGIPQATFVCCTIAIILFLILLSVMTITQCRSYIPNLSTLASCDESTPNSLSSHLGYPLELPILLANNRLESNDFQSNGLGSDDFTGSRTAGLGISYDMCTPKYLYNATDEIQESFSATSSGRILLSPSRSFHDGLEYNPEPLLDGFYNFFDAHLPPSWSFNSIRSGPSSPNDPVCVIPDSLCVETQHLDWAPWPLESISTADFDQIANLALKHMASGSHSSFSSISDLPSSEDLQVDNFAKDSCSETDSSMSHLEEFNSAQMRLHLDIWSRPAPAISPSELMADPSADTNVDYSYILFSPEPEALCLPQCHDFFPDGKPIDEARGSPNLNSGLCVNPDNAVATSENGAYYHVYHVAKPNRKESSDYESSSPESSPFTSPQPRRRKSKKPVKQSKSKVPLIANTGAMDVPLLKTETPVKGESIAEDGLPTLGLTEDGINLGTPVFDAHKGVDLDDLNTKAARYRLRNPGREYHNTWLVSFAGKLTQEGELSDDFRCYIVGCDQVNKRRDHILIHVGAHLDQRPFQCAHWYFFSLAI
jgi:hypothetical protein